MDVGMRAAVDLGKGSGRVCARPRLTAAGYTRCWSRDYDTCPSCAAMNAMYTKKLISSGFGVPDSQFYLLTLTAPSFGKIHKVPHSPSDAVVSCECGVVHPFGSPLGGVPVDVSSYRALDAVRWNAASSELFRRSMMYVGAALPGASWCAVREYQRRGSIHLHIIVRVPASLPSTDVVIALNKVRSYKAGGVGWGRSADVSLLSGDGSASAVRYLAKVAGYAAKTLGKGQKMLSTEQRSFYGVLDAAAVRAGMGAKAVRGFGYGGHLFSKAKDWSSLTRASLVAAAREYAEENSGGADSVADAQLVVDRNADELRALAERLGNTEDYRTDAAAPARVRARLLGDVVGGVPGSELSGACGAGASWFELENGLGLDLSDFE